MRTGYSGTFVISWSQTEVDGLDGATLASLNVGSAWSWRGNALRVDGPSDLLRLEGATGSEQLRKRAAVAVQRLVGQALEKDTRSANADDATDELRLPDRSFVVTILLWFFLGGLGAHRFYAGKIGTGILMLITFGGFGIWWLIDLVLLVAEVVLVGDFSCFDLALFMVFILLFILGLAFDLRVLGYSWALK